MGYFPFFVELADKSGLVIGGGEVALRKIEKLLCYQPRITVVAKEILPEIEKISGITLIRAEFSPEMLENADFVIAATDDYELNDKISSLCFEKRIPVNVVDDLSNCGFIFPAVVKRKNLSVGISSSGLSPTAAVWLKEQIEKLLPERFDEIIDYLGGIRPVIKSRVKPQKRATVMKRLFDEAIAKNRPLNDAELTEILEEMA